ncbi:Thrombospondin type-1 (TSP1) repeat [Trinorchestia longiramus]|nr:Thrombospondin type-1 (TSP1) repeat [Trinorchestia longiramus]
MTSMTPGNQTLVLSCERKRRRNKAVDSKFCGGLPPPPAAVQPCNLQPCPAKWVPEDWGPCSVTCGIGTQTRQVVCKQEVSSTYTMVVQTGACLDPSLLPETQSCQVMPCPGSEGYRPPVDPAPAGNPVWEVDEWEPCSSECGVGTRSRKVRCVKDGVSVPESFCFAAVGSRPANQELCDPGSCTPTAWLFSEWDKTCSAECGSGVVQRKVVCSADGSVSAEMKCDALHRPAETQPCSASAKCHPQWFRGQWGLCRGECGVGRKTRPVACVVEDTPGRWRVVTDDSCVSGRKPSSGRNCQLPSCKPRWYISTWSQCSASCGGGVKRRQAKCMSPSLQHSADCPILTKPATRQPCNLHSCGVPQTVIANVRLPDGSTLLHTQKNGIYRDFSAIIAMCFLYC